MKAKRRATAKRKETRVTRIKAKTAGKTGAVRKKPANKPLRKTSQRKAKPIAKGPVVPKPASRRAQPAPATPAPISIVTGQLPRLDVVIGNNFGHLPMFVGAEKGIFKKHGIDTRMKVVDTGTDMVNAMHNGEAQIGDMSVTTFLKAVHSGEPFKVIGIIMNDATRDNADEPLAIVTRAGAGIAAGKVADLKGKRVGLARGQTSDEYFKMVLRRAGMRYEDLTIENIWSQFGLAPALGEGKVDAVVSWEPYVTAVLEQVAGSFLVIRGGHHMSYVMVATAHGPTVASRPAVIRDFAAGLAGASHYTRNHRDESVEIFAKWVPNTDVAVGKKAIHHISYDPRLSPAVMRAFEAAEDEVLINTLKGAPRLDVPDQFRPSFMAEVEKARPEYFADLPSLT